MKKRLLNLDFDKIMIVILICICAYLWLSKLMQKEDTYYYIDSKPHIVCGKTIYITDYTYEPPNKKELNVEGLLNAIEEICNDQ